MNAVANEVESLENEPINFDEFVNWIAPEIAFRVDQEAINEIINNKLYELKPMPRIIAIQGEDQNGIECVGFITGNITSVFVPKDDLENKVINIKEIWKHVADLAYANNDVKLSEDQHYQIMKAVSEYEHKNRMVISYGTKASI